MIDISAEATAALHSRERAAGYEPARLFEAKALVVGAGAVGQNLLVALGLAGIGHLMVTDFDHFEPHNATRSPLYPSRDEAHRWGKEKATVAARKVAPMMTAPNPEVRAAVTAVQELGDLPIHWADLVFAAVDNPAARAYLTERCQLLAKPLLEAGFEGPDLNLSVFAPSADQACFRCLNPARIGAFSCARYALDAERRQIIPAIQNGAAVLAALQAEQGIQWLHGRASLVGKRAYVNIRSLEVTVATLRRNPNCPAPHRTYGPPVLVDLDADAPIGRLLSEVGAICGPASLRLADSLVVRNFCDGCHTVTQAGVPEWRWLRVPRCRRCGGPFPPAAPGQQPASLDILDSEVHDEVWEISCMQAGVVPGSVVEVFAKRGAPWLLQIPGDLDVLAPPVPLSQTAPGR